jgi:hypothetical protein
MWSMVEAGPPQYAQHRWSRRSTPARDQAGPELNLHRVTTKRTSRTTRGIGKTPITRSGSASWISAT